LVFKTFIPKKKKKNETFYIIYFEYLIIHLNLIVLLGRLTPN
jgi:hypothetical protein